MQVFVDESGDAGLKVAQGSSAYFTIALIVIADDEEADAVNQRIGLLRRELRLAPSFEFKFNKCNRDIRLAFLRAVAPYGFFIMASSSIKRNYTGKDSRSKNPFINT